jgi:hypothetical protein
VAIGFAKLVLGAQVVDEVVGAFGDSMHRRRGFFERSDGPKQRSRQRRSNRHDVRRGANVDICNEAGTRLGRRYFRQRQTDATSELETLLSSLHLERSRSIAPDGPR